jgi:hypothetical protein
MPVAVKSTPAQIRANKTYRDKNKVKISKIQSDYYEANKEILKKKRMERYYKNKALKQALKQIPE